MRTGFARTTQQTSIHFSATEPKRDPVGSEPRARHADAFAAAGIENCFGQASWPRGKDLIDDPESLKVKRAFRRDEFTAKLRARKFLLLCQQHTRAACREVNRGARAGGPPARDNYVVVERTSQVAVNPQLN